MQKSKAPTCVGAENFCSVFIEEVEGLKTEVGLLGQALRYLLVVKLGKR
jgi:hypothetical protein